MATAGDARIVVPVFTGNPSQKLSFLRPVNEASGATLMLKTGENRFIYGRNLGEHLRAKIRLMEKYRHHKPRIDREILWRAPVGQPWPEEFETGGK